MRHGWLPTWLHPPARAPNPQEFCESRKGESPVLLSDRQKILRPSRPRKHRPKVTGGNMAKALGAATYRGRCSSLFWAGSSDRGSRCVCRESSLAPRRFPLGPRVSLPATQSLGHEMLLKCHSPNSVLHVSLAQTKRWASTTAGDRADLRSCPASPPHHMNRTQAQRARVT